MVAYEWARCLMAKLGCLECGQNISIKDAPSHECFKRSKRIEMVNGMPVRPKDCGICHRAIKETDKAYFFYVIYAARH